MCWKVYNKVLLYGCTRYRVHSTSISINKQLNQEKVINLNLGRSESSCAGSYTIHTIHTTPPVVILGRARGHETRARERQASTLGSFWYALGTWKFLSLYLVMSVTWVILDNSSWMHRWISGASRELRGVKLRKLTEYKLGSAKPRQTKQRPSGTCNSLYVMHLFSIVNRVLRRQNKVFNSLEPDVTLQLTMKRNNKE